MSDELKLPAPFGQTGLYGKLPSHGDFVLRRLPQEFVSIWDEWLQQGIAESKIALGNGWEECYREAPVCRFLLAPGTCGDFAWAGLWQPSVDRVGRRFPLTVAASLPSNVDALETMLAAGSWYASLERETAAAFEPDVQFDTLDSNLEQLAFPAICLVQADASEDTLPIVERVVSAFKSPIPQPATSDVVRSKLQSEKIMVGPFDSVWSGMSVTGREAPFLVTKGLPSAARFCAMLDGNWAQAGWEMSEPTGSSG